MGSYTDCGEQYVDLASTRTLNSYSGGYQTCSDCFPQDE